MRTFILAAVLLMAGCASSVPCDELLYSAYYDINPRDWTPERHWKAQGKFELYNAYCN